MSPNKNLAIVTVNDGLIQEIAKVIVDAINPYQIILFGSYVRGVADPNSDLDFIIVADQPFAPGHSRQQEMARLWRLLARFAIAKDILIYSRDEIEHWRNTKNHVIAHALREGRVLYERT